MFVRPQKNCEIWKYFNQEVYKYDGHCIITEKR